MLENIQKTLSIKKLNLMHDAIRPLSFYKYYP